MDPVYMNLQPHPFQKDRMHHGLHYYPGFEATQDQMCVNQARPPMAYGYWPWGNNYGYPYPTGCHTCCSHSYSPAHHAWGSPYSHVPPPHCHRNYAPFPGQYMPPPFYGMEQPPYEHEKSSALRDYHCCGCPNHLPHQKEHKSVRIEKEEPDGGSRKDDSVVPFKFKNSPYPIVWLPPDYISNQAQGKAGNSGNQKDGSAGVRVPENGKFVEQQQPTSWNGWSPLDLSKLVASNQRGDGERHHQGDDGKGHNPFPLFWMPYKHEEREKENLKADNDDTKPCLDSQRVCGGEHKFHSNEENTDGQAASRENVMPLMEMKQHEEKESPKNQEKKRAISVTDGIDNREKKVDVGEKKSPKEVAKRKSPSPPKPSKLPPVCLRVDPLPRRKTGSSRSPSPPSDKNKRDGRSDEASKVLKSSDDKMADKKFKENRGVKTIQVVDGKAHQEKTKDLYNGTFVNVPANSQENVPTSQREEKTKEESISNESTENDAVIKGQSEGAGSAGEENKMLRAEAKASEAKESKKEKLTEEEAAVVIQSAYRGFDTRRWEPIKKLKQIAKVKDQIADVKRHIQAMELSTDFEGCGKKRNFIAETIMNLLLKLDTVQGLHPSIRDVRKSVVKELVSLLQRLDSLMNEKTENSSASESVVRQPDEVKLSQSGGDKTSIDLLEAHQKLLDGGSDSDKEKLDISEANPVGEEAVEKLESEAAVRCKSEGPESAAEPTIKNEDDERNEVFEQVEISIAKEDSVDLVPEQRSETPQGSSSVEPEDLLPIFGELPNYVTDEENNENFDNQGTSGLQHSGIDVEMKADKTSPLQEDRSFDNCKIKGGFARKDDADNNIGDGAIIEREEECTTQQLENTVADMSEPSEASDEMGFPMAETCNTKDEVCKSNEEFGERDANNTIMLETTFDVCSDKETLSQEGKLEQEIGINESAYADEEADVIGRKMMGDATEDDIQQEHMDAGSIADDREPQVEACQVKSAEPIEETSKVEVVTEGGEPQENIEAHGCEDARREEENASQNVVGAVIQENEPQENIEMQGSEDSRGDGENASQKVVAIMSSDEARDSFGSPINPRDERDEGS